MLYDLIVVGGSAIGLFLAEKFSKKGKSVLVLEKNKTIGKKICSGLVSYHIFDYLPKNDLKNFIEKDIKAAKLWVEKTPFLFKGKALVLDREKFDNYLAKRAISAGARVLLQKEVANLQEKSKSVKVFLKSGECLQSKILAGCDGFHSIVAKKSGFPVQKKGIFGIIVFEKKTPKKEDNFVELFFSKKFPGFFAWKIPKKDSTEWGVALAKEKKPFKKLKTFLKGKNIDFLKAKGAFIPSFPLKKTTKERIFLCGDSAGQIKPYTGGGLIYGFECAKIAAEKIINFQNPNLLEYEKAWRNSLMKDIYFGNFLRKCYFLPSFIKKTGLYFLKKRKNIDQDRPSSLF